MMGELSRRRGWTRETLDELGVRALSHFRRKANLYETFPIRERDRVAIPIRDEKGVLRNIRVYYPLGKPESAPAKIMSWGKGHGLGHAVSGGLDAARRAGHFVRRRGRLHLRPLARSERDHADRQAGRVAEVAPQRAGGPGKSCSATTRTSGARPTRTRRKRT